LVYDVGGGVGVDDTKAQVDDIKATCEIANRSMDKPRKFRLIPENEMWQYLGIGIR
jgi:hypothetical protein